MRYLKKAGQRIKLLPPPFPPEEDLYCGKCQEKFDTSSKRRACFDLCGHLSCLKCIFKMNDGCVDCINSKKIETNSKPDATPILVLSSVLAKPVETSDDEEDEVFPEIQRLSLSELPVLDKMPNLEKIEEENIEKEDFKPILITLDDDEEEQKKEEKNLNGVNLDDEEDDDDIIEVPVDEYTKLAGEEERDGHENESGCKVELEFFTEEETEIIEKDIAEEEEAKSEKLRKTGRRKRKIYKIEGNGETNELNVEKVRKRIKVKQKTEINEESTEKDNYSGSKKSFDCKYCKLKFPTKSSLGLHMFQLHLDVRPYPCDICSWPFHTKRGLLNHKITHTDERPFGCNLCGSTFNRKFSLVNHLKKVHDIISSKRGKSSLNPPELPLETEFEVEDDNFKPPKIVGEPYSMATPVQTQTTIIAEKEQLTEQPCTENLNIITSAVSPISSDDQKENKQVLKQEKSTKRLFFRKKWGINHPRKKSTVKQHTSQVRCQICNLSFLGKSKLAAHLRHNHIEERPFSCDICGYSFAQKTKLKIHQITHTIDRPHKCKQCQASFNRKYSLERHIRIMHLKAPRKSESAENKHFQRKTARCPYQQECGQGEFETRQLLAVHMKNEHGDKRPFICDICEYPFQKRKHLKAHMRSHSEEKPFECTLCENKYNRLFSLERHMENSHGVRIRLHEYENLKKDEDEYCPECQSAFGSTDNCYKVAYSECGHIICMECVIKADGLGCGQCTTEHAKMDISSGPDKSPVKRNNLESGELFKDLVDKLNLGDKERNRLLMVEVRVKRLEEMDLGQEYSDKLEEIVRKSLKNHNSEQDDGNIEIITRKNGTKTWECPYCKEHFNEKKDLGVHLHEKHKDVRPFPCDICQWPFSTGRDLERHRMIHTNEKPFKCNLCTLVFNRKSTRDRHVEKVHLKWKRI